MSLDPVAQNNAQGRRPHGFICLHVDDLFMAGDKVFADKVLASIRKDFNVGSEDKNDIMFVGQRIKWKTHDKQGPYISCDQKLAVDAVEEIKFEKHLKDNVACNPQMHTAYRSVLGQLIGCSRTQVHLCYKFSRCASAASSPTIGDVREITITGVPLIDLGPTLINKLREVLSSSSEFIKHLSNKKVSHKFSTVYKLHVSR